MEIPCQCTGDEQRRPNGSFYCERHQCWKTQHWRTLCQTNEAYRRAWDQGTGPGQRMYVASMDPSEAVRQDGWGDKLESWLTKQGITPDRYVEVKRLFGLPPTCGCAKRKEWLNKVGQWLSGE